VVGGSNPLAPTSNIKGFRQEAFFISCDCGPNVFPSVFLKGPAFMG